MFKFLKQKVENQRNSKNLIWKPLISFKDFLWFLKERYSRIRKVLDTRKKLLNLIYTDDDNSNLGLWLWGYVNFTSLLDITTQKIKIPNDIRKIRIDVGLSVNAPVSKAWLNKFPDCVIFGFEPNAENLHYLLNDSKFKKSIGKRFFAFNVALDDDEPGLKTFYMTKGWGTSSLYKPKFFKVRNTTQVPAIRLSDFLSFIPWDQFNYIEHLKIDTQGNDLRVLQSAGSYLSERIALVTAEYTSRNQYEGGCNENDLDKFMRMSGFDFVEGSRRDDDKTYINLKFKHLISGNMLVNELSV